MAQNNALIVATMALADERETGVSLSADKLETLCNLYNTPANIVRQIIEEAKEDKYDQMMYELYDDDLKDASKYYMLYTNSIQKLKDKFGAEVADLRVNIQETINKLKNPE